MGFKDKLASKYAESYLKKYGDRLTQVQGKVLSVKVEPKTILWIFHKLTVSVLIKPERSRNIIKCHYYKKRWFKKIDFISISQGNSLIIQGMKGKKGKENREQIQIVNIRNLTTKKDLVPMQGEPKVQKVRADRRFK